MLDLKKMEEDVDRMIASDKPEEMLEWLKKKREKMSIIVQCEGNCSETMEFKILDWGDDIDYCIEFRASTFYAGQSIVGIMRERIKFAWEAIRKGNYIHNEILTNKRSLELLRDKLTDILED
jgi:hypothetical protein